MVTLLKIICFAIWICIMVFLIIAPRPGREKTYTRPVIKEEGRLKGRKM